MKNIFLGFALISSFTAFAGIEGIPSEDPIVKNLRTRFESAKSPTSNDLLNKRFSCKLRDARKSNFKQSSNEVSFSTHDGLYILESKGTVTNAMLMVDNGSEVIGVTSFSGYVGYEAYRVTENKDLIIEWSVTKDKPYEQVEPIADAGEGTAVISYGVCVAK